MFSSSARKRFFSQSLSVSKCILPNSLNLRRIPPSGNIPKLQYGLDRVLFNQGVHWLKDNRSNVFNFDPFLENIVEPEDFNMDHIPPFIPASSDKSLMKMAAKHSCKYVSSTSSISSTMALIYSVLSMMKPLNLDFLSQSFVDEPRTLTVMTRSPSAVILTPQNGTTSIVAEKLDGQENVLSKLGQIMERLLTEPKENYQKMLMNSKEKPRVKGDETYSYTAAGNILLRSQLDCYDPRLPRKTFDLKTRATLPIRMDVKNYKNYQNYPIHTLHGLFSSFEREYFDMCRSALLKYNFQVRIGNMDGIFVAHHNTAKIFGFQYISREEMDERIYGNSITGDSIFNVILQVYNQILETIVGVYPSNSSLRLSFSIDRYASKLTIFSEDISDEKANLKQFTILLQSTINGRRPTSLLLDAHGADEWKLYLKITESAQASQSQYDAVRSTITAPKPFENSNKPSPFIKSIDIHNRSIITPKSNIPEVIAPWTFQN